MADLLCGEISLCIIYLNIVCGSNGVIFSINCLIGDLDLLKLCDLLKSKLCLYAVGSGRTDLCLVSVKSHIEVLEVYVEVHTLHLHTGLAVTNHTLDLVVDHALGDITNELLADSGFKLFAKLSVSGGFVSLFNFSRNVGAIFGKSVKFGYVKRKIIVKLRQLVESESVELYLKYGFLACKISGVVLGGESYVNVKGLANVLANDALLKAGDELTRTELEVVSLSLAALESNVSSKPS